MEDDDGNDHGNGNSKSKTKREREGVGEEADDERERERSTTATTTTTMTTMEDALWRISTHMLNERKFAKASHVMKRLMLSEGESLERAHGKAAFACATNAMTPNARRALRGETRTEYEELFEVFAAFAPVIFNAKQRRRMDVYGLYARRINALFADDSFEFNKAVKFIQDKVETCAAYVEEDDDDKTKDDADVPPTPEGASEEEAKEMKAQFLRARQAEREAEIELRQIEEDTRVALVVALETCASMYSRPWSQTTIDMMANFFHERRAKFSQTCRDDIVKIWDELRKKKNIRQNAQGSARGGDMTTFERDAARVAGTAVSARGAVGGERLKDGRGESAVNLFG